MRRQQGFSIFAIAFFLALVGFVISLALKIIPPWMDFRTFSGVTLETLKQPRMGLQPNEAIIKRIDTQMSINNLHLRDFPADALTISREGGALYAEIDYTIENPVYTSENFNISLSLRFNKTHEIEIGGD